MFSLIWKYIDDNSEAKDSSKTEIYVFVPKLMIFLKETTECMEKDELTAPELFHFMCRL